MFVFFGALAEDVSNDTHDAQLVAAVASQIPETQIPPCPMNAAKVFLRFCHGKSGRPYKWMLNGEVKRLGDKIADRQ